jgi:hypothetical protein
MQSPQPHAHLMMAVWEAEQGAQLSRPGPDFRISKEPTMTTEDKVEQAARILIGTVKSIERFEGEQSASAELELEIELAGGGFETWKISIERVSP